MSKIFSLDFRTGSLIDSVSGEKGNLTAGDGGFVRTEKGMALYFDGVSYIDMNTPDEIDIDNNDFTLIINGAMLDGGSTRHFGFSDSNGNSLVVGDGNFAVHDSDSSQSRATLKDISKIHNYIFTWNHTNKEIILYVDSIEENTVGSAIGNQPPDSTLQVGLLVNAYIIIFKFTTISYQHKNATDFIKISYIHIPQ